MDTNFFAQSGSPTNPTIIFLHGSPFTRRMWTPQMERLTEFFCLTPDLPRHGRSAELPTRSLASIRVQVDHLIRERVLGGQVHPVLFTATVRAWIGNTPLPAALRPIAK